MFEIKHNNLLDRHYFHIDSNIFIEIEILVKKSILTSRRYFKASNTEISRLWYVRVAARFYATENQWRRTKLVIIIDY